MEITTIAGHEIELARNYNNNYEWSLEILQ